MAFADPRRVDLVVIRILAPLILVLAAATAPFAVPPLADAAETRTRSFKLVKPPALGVRRRLTITTTRSVAPLGAIRRVARHGWFWREASDDLAAADPARFAPLASAAGARLGGRERRALVQSVSETWRVEISAAAQRAQISEALLIAVIAAESGGNARAVSPVGALGLGQLMPGTARRFNVADPFEPGENLRGSADYLSSLLTMFDDDGLLALAGYNAGENAVLRYNGVPPYAETRDYVPIVLSYYNEAQNLCLFTPTGPRAPCVLMVLP